MLKMFCDVCDKQMREQQYIPEKSEDRGVKTLDGVLIGLLMPHRKGDLVQFRRVDFCLSCLNGLGVWLANRSEEKHV